jgi:CRP-like cAMP-binding protein
VIVKDIDEDGNIKAEGVETIVSELLEGMYFGELALISDERRLATIKTATR